MKKQILLFGLIGFLFFLPYSVSAQELPLSVTVENQLEQTNTINLEATTGENQATADSVTTGDVVMTTDLTTVTNTTTVGSDIDFTVNELPTITPVESSSNENTNATVIVENTAVMVNEITIQAQTGENIATAGAQIDTGNIDIQVNQTNVGNTTLVGDNWHFGINSTPSDANMILPNEFEYLNNPTTVQPELRENIPALSTGSPTQSETGGEQLNTGQISIQTDIRETLNQTLLGDNWILIQINKYAPWHGTLEGWWGSVYEDESQLLAWYQFPEIAQIENQTNIQNQVLTTNNLAITANTGDNLAYDNGTIQTGEINIKVNIFNQLNTTIIGDNWYYQIINVFREFSGNIVLPKPDLYASFGDKQLKFGNQGDYIAREVTLRLFDNNGQELSSQYFAELAPNTLNSLMIAPDVKRAIIESKSFELFLDNNTAERLIITEDSMGGPQISQNLVQLARVLPEITTLTSLPKSKIISRENLPTITNQTGQSTVWTKKAILGKTAFTQLLRSSPTRSNSNWLGLFLGITALSGIWGIYKFRQGF